MKSWRRVLAVLLFWCVSFCALAEVAVPALSGRVVDLTATLSAAQMATLSNELAALERAKGSQLVVLLVPTTAPESIEQYSIRVVEQWKLGRKKVDDGVLLLIAKEDRALRIEVGYGLEGALNDATSKRIISETIVPSFKTGDFYGGILAGVTEIAKVIQGEPLPEAAPLPAASSNAVGWVFDHFEGALIAILLIGTVFRALFGRLLGALMAGGGTALIVGLISGSFVAGFSAAIVAFFVTLLGDVLWASRVGGSFGGRSGGGGGFGGGGGGFGGGGASGRW